MFFFTWLLFEYQLLYEMYAIHNMSKPACACDLNQTIICP